MRGYLTESHQSYILCREIIITELLKSQLRYSNPFRNAKAKKVCVCINFADFDLKFVAMARSLQRSEKESNVSNLQSNTYHMVKTLWQSVK